MGGLDLSIGMSYYFRIMCETKTKKNAIEKSLSEVREVIRGQLSGTVLGPMLDDLEAITGGGKMLRSRLMFRVGPVTGVDKSILVSSAAAVEMVHAASLLHDDTIDGGKLRRGQPAYWVKKGASGAIILGDLLVCKAIDLLCRTGAIELVSAMVNFAGEMCDAEAEQELILRDEAPEWEKCVSIARRKTGAMFAFAGYAAAGDDDKLRECLTEAGYIAGTGYQLADDVFDAFGNSELSDKTLGRDAYMSKVTAVSAWEKENIDPVEYIDNLYGSTFEVMKEWPDLSSAWAEYMEQDLRPAIQKFIQDFPAIAV